MLRKQLATLILPREVEFRSRWESRILRTYYAFSLYDLSLQRTKSIEYLSKPHAPTKRSTMDVLMRYKDALSWIYYRWYITREETSFDDVRTLYHSIWTKGFTLDKVAYMNNLQFLQDRESHPIITSLGMFLLTHSYAAESSYMLPFSHLLHYLYLCKTGWDFRGFVLLEDYLHTERAYFKDQLKKSLERNDATPWFEYATAGFVQVTEHALQSMSITNKIQGISDQYFRLSDRQRTILVLLEEPNAQITNKKVQQECGISQITASRELAKLVELGFIYPHGKGRSTTYMKVS